VGRDRSPVTRVPRRFFVDGVLATGAEVELGPDELAHARVLRLEAGESVEALDGAGGAWRATVVSTAGKAVRMRLDEPAPNREPGVELDLAVALLDSDRFDLVVRSATEVGVARIVPLVTERVRPGLARGAIARRGRWERIAREAVKQCGRARIPEIAEPTGIGPLLDAARVAGAAVVAAAPEGEPLQPPRGEASLVLVGPEGGWTATERRLLSDRGVRLWSLGSRVLRAETAAVVAAARILGST